MTFSTFLRPAALAAIALTLAACGGKASFPINGTIATTSTTDSAGKVTTFPTLIYDGLVLSTNGMSLSVAKNATSFSFPNTISYGEVYNVTIAHKPDHQNCTTINQSTALETATGTAGLYASINISLTCFLDTHLIGGTVTGLLDTAQSVVLTNGTTGGIATLPGTAAAVAYTFSTAVTYGNSYGVTVLTQPTGYTCTVENPSGVMGDVDINNINVKCTANPVAPT